MAKETNSLLKYYKTIAKYHKIISIIGLLIFLPVLIKLLIKGVNNIDLFMDLSMNIFFYAVLLIVVTIIRKKYNE